MNRIAAPAHIAADESRHTAAFSPRSLLARFLKSLISTIIREEDNDIAKRYEGFSWCDQTEHNLHHDVMTGRHTGHWS
jgi:hypothetical protein